MLESSIKCEQYLTRVREMIRFDYLRPETLDEAFKLLNSEKEIYVKAGGTDLLEAMRSGKIKLKKILGFDKIKELNYIREDNAGNVEIAALNTVNEICKSEFLRKKYPFVCDSAAMIGSNQLRNIATIGGNICNASPSADFVPILLCLDSICKIGSIEGSRELPLKEFFKGPGQTDLKKGEILLAVIIPKSGDNIRGIYLKSATRRAMDIAVVGVACTAVLSNDNQKFEKVRIALGAVAPTPVRAEEAEKILEGKEISEELIKQASAEAANEVTPISDIRGSKDYRNEIIKVLVNRAIMKLIETDNC